MASYRNLFVLIIWPLHDVSLGLVWIDQIGTGSKNPLEFLLRVRNKLIVSGFVMEILFFQHVLRKVDKSFSSELLAEHVHASDD